MNATPLPPTLPAEGASRWQRLSAASLRGFHAYGNWLVGISWKRFFLLALLVLVVAGIVHDMPPFTWTVKEEVSEPARPRMSVPVTPGDKGIRIETTPRDGREGVDIAIGPDGIRIGPRRSGEGPAPADGEDTADKAGEAPAPVLEERPARTRIRTVRYGIGDELMQLTVLWIIASMILKIAYKGRLQAEVQAARATETAEAESLKRQVVEARMAAMQAQVEPHFLFNTLASIDHLIETDPPRASQMQKNLIVLLRASMPTMRETAGGQGGGARELGREIAVIRPYLEILKVRMEERLTTEIDVPEGLLSAEFPPMMIQTLVENAIKHGLEPKPEGGLLRVAAQIVHGRLQVTVTDTGLGFGRAATAGTGVGLANVRERLHLLYGPRAGLTVAENPAGGTAVTITVPYRTVESALTGAADTA